MSYSTCEVPLCLFTCVCPGSVRSNLRDVIASPINALKKGICRLKEFVISHAFYRTLNSQTDFAPI